VAELFGSTQLRELLAAYAESMRESVESARENRERCKNAPTLMPSVPFKIPYLRRSECLKIIAEFLLECATEERVPCPAKGDDGRLSLNEMASVAQRMYEKGD